MKVKPADPNAVIRDPHTMQPLPADGGDVPDNSFWHRRIADGDVVHVEEDKDDREVVEDVPEPERDERDAVAKAADRPRGNEPLSPLTTRKGE